MSHMDEARYGRACLLLLNVCPFTLRHVINDYYTKHGFTDLECFLKKHKHDVYHIMNKRCCCRLIQSRMTPMNRSQWDLLFIKNSSSCGTGYTGDCPCQYDSKPGVTSDVMDITLCCLFIKNICSRHPGINMSHIDTLRTIRNYIVHAESAQLDVSRYNGYWNQVKFALSDLAYHVSSRVQTDTLSMVQELETRVMNAGELGEIRKVIVDKKRIEVVEERVSQVEKDVDIASEDNEQIKKHMKETTEKVTGIEASMSQTAEELRKLGESQVQHVEETTNKMTQMEDGMAQTADEIKRLGDTVQHVKQTVERVTEKDGIDEMDVKKLKQRLVKCNNDSTKRITLSPLQDRGNSLPIELLFAEVVIHQDPRYTKMEDDSENSDSDSSDEDFVHSKRHKEMLHKKKRELVNPHDIFKFDYKVPSNVFMLGDAAHGKTTYCFWLVKKWCNAQRKDIEKLDKWEETLKEFDFVFMLQFRYVNPHRDCVIDMICENVHRRMKDCKITLRYVLSSEDYKCLIIMDGLDEWNPNEESIQKLTCQRMPNLDGLSGSVTIFISMRPWVFPAISKMIQMDDSVIEILGLSETGMETVIRNVLINSYQLKEDFPDVYERIKLNLEQKTLKTFMQIPLLAVVCVQILYEGKQIVDSMASFYAAMLNMLIERAHDKHKLQIQGTVDCVLPKVLSEHENIINCISVLLKLGKVAYEGLISNKTRLVFQKRKLEKEIGASELQFALDVGLVSQKEAPSLLTKNVSVHFFHKSMQEFLAVVYIVATKEGSESFCRRLLNVKTIMELSNTILFICDMCPTVGSVISHRVVNVLDSDTEIKKYRVSPWKENSTVSEVFKLQLSWYRRLQRSHSGSSVTFHFSDAYLNFNSDDETVRTTRKLLSDQHVDIRSLCLVRVPINGERGITNKELNHFLCNKHNNTRSTLMVHVDDVERHVQPICIPSLEFLYLDNVKIDITQHSPSFLIHMPLLRELRLWRVTLDGIGLKLFPTMEHIGMIWLGTVRMSTIEWQRFIRSVLKVEHRFDVELYNTNIDDKSLTKIQFSPNFIVERDSWLGKRKIHFTRIWPPSHV